MKTALILAVPALSLSILGVSQAESSLNLYGILDSGYGYSQYKFNGNGIDARSTSSGLHDGFLNSSRWGMKGSEDLGNGLRAIFTLENKFNLGDGSAKGAFTRKAFVGLSSDSWGTFTMGRQKTISDDFNGANTVKSLGKTSRAFGAGGTSADNMFKYVSPSFGGLQAGFAYATSGTITRTGIDAKDQDRDNLISTGLLYKNGPWRLSAAYDRQNANDKNGHQQGYIIHNWMLAAAYDFDLLKLSLAYGQDKNGKLNKPADVDSKTIDGVNIPGLGDYNNQGFKSYNYMVGINAPMAGGILGLSWTHTKSNLDDVYSDLGKGHLNTKAQNIYAANYRYPLSKRTTVVAYGAYGTGLAYLDGFKVKEVGLGLNHKF